jgi:hypothetical protein
VVVLEEHLLECLVDPVAVVVQGVLVDRELLGRGILVGLHRVQMAELAVVVQDL